MELDLALSHWHVENIVIPFELSIQTERMNNGLLAALGLACLS